LEAPGWFESLARDIYVPFLSEEEVCESTADMNNQRKSDPARNMMRIIGER
jgi:hypothetical protein